MQLKNTFLIYIILCLSILVPLTVEAAPTTSFAVQEIDGTPIIWNPTYLKVPNGSLTVSGRIATLDYAASSDLAAYLKLNQTTPQEIINGFLTYEASHAAFTDGHQLVDKEYVDQAVTAINIAYYCLDTTASISDYKLTQIDIPVEVEANVSDASVADDAYLQGWMSPVGGTLDTLVAGIYECHITAEKTAGTKTLKLYWTLVEYKADTSEVLIATSEESDTVTTKAAQELHLTLAADYTITAGSRIIGKIHAAVSGVGNAPSVTLYYLGNTTARWTIPSNVEVLTNIFVPYTGATAAVNLGSYDFTTTGTIEGATLTEGGVGIYNITESDAAYAAVLGADQNYVTDADITLLGNTSGSNTGDDSGTDDQKIDVAQLNGTDLELSLEGDGEATKTIDLSGLGGGSTALDDIGDPDAATGISLGDNEAITITSAEDTGTVLSIIMTDTDLSGDTFGLDIIHAGTANSTYKFLRLYDNTSDLQLAITSNGNIDTEGTITTGSWMLCEYGLINNRKISDTAATTAELAFQKKRDGAPTANVADEDYLGKIVFEGYHTDEYSEGAIIRAIVDGTTGEDDMPTRIEILTSPDGTDAPVLAVTIDSNQDTTFANFPITPSAMPDADYEVSNKKYHDDNDANTTYTGTADEIDLTGTTFDIAEPYIKGLVRMYTVGGNIYITNSNDEASPCTGYMLKSHGATTPDFKMGFVGGNLQQRVDVGWNEIGQPGANISFYGDDHSTNPSDLQLMYGSLADASEGQLIVYHTAELAGDQWYEVMRFDADEDIHLNPDCHGDVYCFYDEDVADGANGKILTGYRKASEGDKYWKMLIDQYQGFHLHSDASYFWLQAGVYDVVDAIIATKDNFYVGHEWLASADAPAFRVYSYPTGESMTYVQLVLNDTTDNYEWTRESAQVGAMDFQMPTLFDDVTVGGSFFPKQVTDNAMDATNGTEGEIVYNLHDDKFYGCTVTGTPATWAAFN